MTKRKVDLNKKGLFSLVEGVLVILNVGGAYKQVEVYQRGGQLYAAITKTGFIALYKGSRTSKPSISWRELVSTTNDSFEYSFGAMDWMELSR